MLKLARIVFYRLYSQQKRIDKDVVVAAAITAIFMALGPSALIWASVVWVDAVWKIDLQRFMTRFAFLCVYAGSIVLHWATFVRSGRAENIYTEYLPRLPYSRIAVVIALGYIYVPVGFAILVAVAYRNGS